MTICSYKELGREPIVGDRVLIADKKSGHRWNSDGDMDKYLSTVMTVKSIIRSLPDFCLKMVEDERDNNAPADGWRWFPEMIVGVINEEIDEDVSEWAGSSSISNLLTL